MRSLSRWPSPPATYSDQLIAPPSPKYHEPVVGSAMPERRQHGIAQATQVRLIPPSTRMTWPVV